MHIVSVQTTSERGGGEYANVDLLDALAAHGERVLLLTNLPDLVTGTQVPVQEIDLGPKLARRSARRVVIASPRYALRLLSTLRAVARTEPIDALLLHYKKEQLLSLLIPRRLAPRIVWAEWGPLPAEMRRGVARWLYLRAARRTAAIVAVSDGTAQSLVAAGVPAEQVEVLPNVVEGGVPVDGHALRERWGLAPQAIVVTCVSRFQRRKRNDVVIDMLDHLDCPDVVLVLAGEGEERAALEARAAHHGDRVRFVGTPRGWIRELMAASDLVVFAPSPTEGAPRSIILAQLAGRPVVATASEGAAELIPEGTGAIVNPPNDPAALAGAVAAYVADPERRRREGERSRELAVARYDREDTIRRWLAVLGGR